MVTIKNPENYFYVNNGVVLHGLKDLGRELENMDENTYNHHCNDERNDFANWVKEILKEKALAKKISSSASKEEVMEAINKKLKSTKASKKKGIIAQIVDAFTDE